MVLGMKKEEKRRHQEMLQDSRWRKLLQFTVKYTLEINTNEVRPHRSIVLLRSGVIKFALMLIGYHER